MRSAQGLFVPTETVIVDLGQKFILDNVRNGIMLVVIFDRNKIYIAIACIFNTQDDISAFRIIFKRKRA